MSKPNPLFDTQASVERFLDLLNQRQFDKAFQLVFKHAKTIGDERFTNQFAHAYRDFMKGLIERHVDVILEKAKQGVEAYKATQIKQRLSEASSRVPSQQSSSNHASGKTAAKPGHVNPNGVIVRRAKHD